MVMRPTLQKLAVALGTFYVVYGGGLYWVQDTVLFPAPEVSQEALSRAAASSGAREVYLKASDGTALYAWHRGAGHDRLVLLFHGNGDALPGRIPQHDQLVEWGWDVLQIAYRGYPGSEGVPSEAGLGQDARAAWTFATEELGFTPDRIVLHGESLGGGVVGTLMTEVEPAALVLVSAFTSVYDLSWRYTGPLYPRGLLLKHPFLTSERAPRVQYPVLLFHGEADRVVPVHHGRTLSELFPKARYVEVPDGGHGLLTVVDETAEEIYRDFLEEQVPNR